MFAVGGGPRRALPGTGRQEPSSAGCAAGGVLPGTRGCGAGLDGVELPDGGQ
ncbi:hypothetical protein ABZ656_42020 [Streptomyces sp. NPDC007095]|uniref:hypothetical protein n=1 Tax=Streptomyces sp. NPDC007095 TaxID=3154482 RepID=UPI0015D61D9C